MKKKRSKIISIVMAYLFLFSTTAWAMPQEGKVISGNSTITKPDAQTMHITQTTDKSIINWQGYSIGAKEKVQYFQPGSNSISLNRVTGVDPSNIYGHLSANGQVWVINPNGLLVGSGAKINTGSFLGSTLNISDDDFLKGNYKFKQQGALTSIKNIGSIISQNGGYVALISPEVVNEGSITANLGKAWLATGSEVTLNFAGNDLFGFTIDKEAAAAALGITNKGIITANGGEVILSAKVASAMMKTVVNNEGVIEAKTIAEKDGRIYLLGGMEHNAVEVSGRLDASAPTGGNGGFIETSAAKVKVKDSAVITTYASYGKTGTWLIDPTEYTISATGDETGAQLSGRLASNNIIIDTSGGGTGNGDINVNEDVSWSSHMLTLSAARDVNINAIMTASGSSTLTMNTGTSVAGGTVKVGFKPGDGNGFAGRVDFGGRSGGGLLTINSNGYTVINDVNQLQNISIGLGGYYALGGAINATGFNGFVPLGDNTTPFTGVFDGLGNIIDRLNITLPGADYVGLFGYAGSGSVIRNVGLTGGSVIGTNDVGSLVGWNNGAISNSYNASTVSGASDSVGGLVGYNNGGAISNSYNTGAVTETGAGTGIGGLVGYNALGAISYSYNTGAVSSTVTGTNSAGGLVGENFGGAISYSHNSGAVTINSGDYVGGLVGYNNGDVTNNGTISYSYNTGIVNGGATTGGLTGYNEIYASIDNSYNTGSVTGTGYHVGGLVGANYGDISNSYNTGAVNGTGSGVGGLVGHNETNVTGGTISNSYNTGNVTGGIDENVGGLVGYNERGSITDSYNTGAVNSTGDNVGGLVGKNEFGDISTSYSSGAITGADNVGGLVGLNSCGNINDAYSIGAVTGANQVGGLVGHNDFSDGGTINNTYSSGLVTGTGVNIGGLVGYKDPYGAITNSYWDRQTSNQVHSAGSADTDGKTTAEMMKQATFAGFDFTNTGTGKWWMSEDNTRPFLRMEYKTTNITNAHQLQLMVLDLGATYTLANNIDMSELTNVSKSGMWNTSTGFLSIGGSVTPFTGSFNGQGYTISGMYINRPTEDYVGLFGYTGNGSVISNVGILGGFITGKNYVGGLVGYNTGTISNSYNTGAVTGTGMVPFGVGGLGPYSVGGSYIGGLAGYSIGGTITGSHNTGVVTGGSYVGGLVGHNEGNITNSYNTGVVTGAGDYVGGLLGENWYSDIRSSYSTGIVNGTGDYVGGLIGFNWYSNVYTSNSIGAVTGRDYVGGLIGLSGCDISESYSSGAVSGRNYVGGLIGKSYDSLSNTYSIGSVTGTSYVGGLVGSNYGPISNSYSTGAVAGTTNIGGLVGSNSSVVTASFWDVNTSGQTHSAGSADTYGKSTADMKTLATFTAAGWDIDGTIGATGTIWRMKDGVTYPLLRLFDPNTITGFTAPSITAVATAPTSHNLDVYDLLKNKSGVMTEGGNPGGGLLAQQTPHFEIDPSVFSNE